ncbi:MAG: hypothetical protein U0T56_05635 [Ferruginibacter sp.]
MGNASGCCSFGHGVRSRFFERIRHVSKSINRKHDIGAQIFFKFQLRQGLLVSSPMAGTIAPKIGVKGCHSTWSRSRSRPCSPAEFPDDWHGQTDRLILNYFHQTETCEGPN